MIRTKALAMMVVASVALSAGAFAQGKPAKASTPAQTTAKATTSTAAKPAKKSGKAHKAHHRAKKSTKSAAAAK
jgi:hypothetical protein